MSDDLSANLIIRLATSKDAPAIAALHVQTFIETHGGPGPTYQTRASQWQAIFENPDKDWFFFVVENSTGELVGFAKGQPYKESELSEYQGELNKIYLLRAYHRRGLGKSLIKHVAKEFAERGINSMLLFGDAHNPSNRFYEAMGGQKIFAKNGDFHGAYGWPNLLTLMDANGANQR